MRGLGTVGRNAWTMAGITLLLEGAGLLIGLLLLLTVGQFLGDDAEGDFPWVACMILATGPMGDYFHARPPHRVRGALAGGAALALVLASGVIAADRWLPSVGGNVTGALAVMIAFPVAAGVFVAVAGPRPGD
ncbi:hypothetical protein ACFCX4_19640 [Kitasatospora sp. NPDC056327]|uniref:hypothetical protein n=1 Tax=Kitasatospora sp. NPDC056327 TaxID=3345785 RepID=UPI0035DE5A7F